MPLKDVALKQPADQRIPTGKFIVRPFPPDAPNSLVRNVRDNHTVQAAPEAANRTRQKPYDCLWHKIKPDTVLSVLKTTETSGGTEESGFPGCGGHHMPPLFFCDTKNSTPPRRIFCSGQRQRDFDVSHFIRGTFSSVLL